MPYQRRSKADHQFPRGSSYLGVNTTCLSRHSSYVSLPYSDFTYASKQCHNITPAKRTAITVGFPDILTVHLRGTHFKKDLAKRATCISGRGSECGEEALPSPAKRYAESLSIEAGRSYPHFSFYPSSSAVMRSRLQGLNALRKKETWALQPEPSTFAPNSSFSNKDMDPVPEHLQTWTTMNYIFYWISDATNVAVWELASSMIAIGLSWLVDFHLL